MALWCGLRRRWTFRLLLRLELKSGLRVEVLTSALAASRAIDFVEILGSHVKYESSPADCLPMRLRNKTAQLFAR
jgi:hypothetical protein